MNNQVALSTFANRFTKFNQAKSQRRQRLFALLGLLVLVSLIFIFPDLASAQGLDKGVTILTTLKTQIYNIVSVLAGIIIIVIGVCYAAKWATLETCMRWGVGCLIVGGGSQLASMMLGS